MSNHTKGEFKVKPCANGGKIVSFGEYSIQFANEHDAYLFVESGTVANETGMTPRHIQERLETAEILLEAQKAKIKRLNEQNEYLKEALERAYNFLSPISNQWEGRDTQEGQLMLSRMCSVLNK